MLSQTDEGVPLLLFGSDALTTQLRQAALTVGAVDYFQLPEELDSLTPARHPNRDAETNNGAPAFRG